MIWTCAQGCAEDTDQGSDDSWECVEARNAWEQCDGGSVVWCHAATHGDFDSGHFHEGANCADDGLRCVELDEQTAACSSSDMSCEEGFTECRERDALNCFEGTVATMRCSIAEDCIITDMGARCVSKEE